MKANTPSAVIYNGVSLYVANVIKAPQPIPFHSAMEKSCCALFYPIAAAACFASGEAMRNITAMPNKLNIKINKYSYHLYCLVNKY